jgi:hypothetical protein
VTCEKCGRRRAYLNTDWCEPCLWNLIQNDQQQFQSYKDESGVTRRPRNNRRKHETENGLKIRKNK